MEYGFTINASDPCVVNKIVDGKQLTVVCHVDDIKVSHVDRDVVDNTVTWFRNKYETLPGNKQGRMTVTCGRVHQYLGMSFHFRKNGSVHIGMLKYVDDIIADFTDERKINSASKPSSSVLFKIRPESEDLPNDKSKVFHTFVSKLLYLSQRERHDIAISVAFLSTRVIKPLKDDWNKLIRCVRYLNGTKNLLLTLSE